MTILLVSKTQIIRTAILFVFGIFQGSKDEMIFLESARKVFEVNAGFSYDFKYEIHTEGHNEQSSGSCNFSKSTSPIGYDFVARLESTDAVYIHGVLKQVYFDQKKVELHDAFQQKAIATNFIPVVCSPVMQVRKPLVFVQDTIMHNTSFANYKVVTTDSSKRSNNTFTEEHLFIDEVNFTVGRYERRRVSNGMTSKQMIFEYSNYKFDKTKKELDYSVPKEFTTSMFGQEQLDPLQEGIRAPFFGSVGLSGSTISLEKLRGRKILLDFSVNNCDACESAFDYLLSKDFRIRDDIEIVYVNPSDDRITVESYLKKYQIPYTTIVDGSDIANLYRVTAYPTFILLTATDILRKRLLATNKNLSIVLKRPTNKSLIFISIGSSTQSRLAFDYYSREKIKINDGTT